MSARLIKTSTPGVYRRGGRYVVAYRDPEGRQCKRSARTLAEARELKARLGADIARGEYRPQSRLTFREYATAWLDEYAGRTSRGLRDTTRREYRRAIERRAIPHFGNRRLTEIGPRDVKAYVAEVTATGVSRNTVRLALAPVKALFATAVEDELIRSNPASGVRLPAQDGVAELAEQERVKALTETQLEALLVATPGESRLLVRFLADTGLRVGEATALQWQDVEFGQRRIHVRRRLYEGQYAPPKSRHGRRVVPLSSGLAQALWDGRKAARSHDAPVFPSRDGSPLDSSTVFRLVKAAGKRTGVPWVGPHALRHTCGTRLFRAGLNAKQVQLWLGHHSPAFTLATYVHLLPEDLPEPAFFDVVETSDEPAGGLRDHRPGQPYERRTLVSES